MRDVTAWHLRIGNPQDDLQAFSVSLHQLHRTFPLSEGLHGNAASNHLADCKKRQMVQFVQAHLVKKERKGEHQRLESEQSMNVAHTTLQLTNGPDPWCRAPVVRKEEELRQLDSVVTDCLVQEDRRECIQPNVVTLGVKDES